MRLPSLPKSTDEGYVYVLKRDSAYKIGFTRKGLTRRMRDNKAELILVIKTGQRPAQLEYLIANRFIDKRLPDFLPNDGGKKEWYALTDSDLAWLRGLSTFLNT